TLRAPFVPSVLRELGSVDGFLEYAWPQLAPSVDTSGFLGSALYMVDMALDAVETVYEPLLSRESLRAGGLAAAELSDLDAGLDDAAIARVKQIIDGALPALATLMMHCCAMRVGLGITAREVVTGPPPPARA